MSDGTYEHKLAKDEIVPASLQIAASRLGAKERRREVRRAIS